jgi:hypothetical protein
MFSTPLYIDGCAFVGAATTDVACHWMRVLNSLLCLDSDPSSRIGVMDLIKIVPQQVVVASAVKGTVEQVAGQVHFKDEHAIWWMSCRRAVVWGDRFASRSPARSGSSSSRQA